MIEWRELEEKVARAQAPISFGWRKMKVASAYHERLGVRAGASRDEIRRAYRRMAVLCHPDRQPEVARSAAEERMKQLNQAYQALSRDERDGH